MSAAVRLGAVARDHPYLALFVLALAARVALIAVLQVTHDGFLFVDDRNYSMMALQKATGDLQGWSEYEEWLYLHTLPLLGPITGIYAVVGEVSALGALWVALAGAGAATLTARLASELMPLPAAMAAGAIVALLPSQVLWSSIILKDAFVWLALCALAVIAAVAARTTGRRLLPWAAAAAVTLSALGVLRLHTLVIAGWALVLAGLFSAPGHRLQRTGVAALLALVVPWAFGAGPAGIERITNTGGLAEKRAANAQGADTAFVPGTVNEKKDESVEGGALPADVTHLPVGAAAVLLRPFPWESTRASVATRMASIENLLWYVVLLFAAVGLAGAWRHRRVLAFPMAAGLGVLGAYALTEGNLGTAYRHRGELVWVVAVLAVQGALVLAAARARRRAAGAGGTAAALQPRRRSSSSR